MSSFFGGAVGGRQFISADEVGASAAGVEVLLKTLRFTQASVGKPILSIVATVEVTASAAGSLRLRVGGFDVAQALALVPGQVVLSGPLHILAVSPYTVELWEQSCTIGLTEMLVEV